MIVVVGLADTKRVALSKMGLELVCGNLAATVTGSLLSLLCVLLCRLGVIVFLLGVLLCRFRVIVLLLRVLFFWLGVLVRLRRGFFLWLGGPLRLRFFLFLIRLVFLFLLLVVLLLCEHRSRSYEGKRQNCCADKSN